MGDWKLLKMGKESPELYNLVEDIGEKTDLAAKQPDKVKELQAAHDAWNAQLAEPQWGRQGGNRKPVNQETPGEGRRARRGRGAADKSSQAKTQ
jgi:hypothetical protein